MRRSNFGSVWKHHYTRFPDMPLGVVPPAYDDSSKEAICVFPIYDRFFDKQSTDIEDWLVRSACWARRSWILNTDAVHRNIPFVFYVQESDKDRVLPILKANGVEPSYVLYFDGSSFQESIHRHYYGAGGQQTSVFSDPQFSDYEWVLQIDADMFMARPPGRGGTLSFFQWFADKTDGLGDFACVHLHGEKRIGEMRWPVINEPGSGGEESREEWIAMAAEFSHRNIDEGSWFRGMSAAITAFRAKLMHEYAHERLQWITEVGRAFETDEGVFGLMHFMGIPVWGIMNEMGLDGVWDVADLHRIREKGEFYLAHMGLPHEWDWRSDIGVDDVSV